MTCMDLIVQLDVKNFSEIMFDFIKNCVESQEELQERLSEEVTKEELQRINAAALREGRQPLSFSG